MLDTTIPKNGFQLLRRLFFDPLVMQELSTKITKSERSQLFIKGASWLLLMLVCLMSITFITTLMFDFSTLQQINGYPATLISQWGQETSLLSRIGLSGMYILQNLENKFLYGLGMPLVLLFIIGHGWRSGDLSSLLVTPVFVAWINTIFAEMLMNSDLSAVETPAALIASFIFLVSFGYVFNCESALRNRRWIGFVGIVIGAFFSFADLIAGILFVAGFYIGFFRLFILPWYLFKKDEITFTKNPYIRDGLIFLPLPKIDNELVKLVYVQPDVAAEFVNFLEKYRPFQKKLADRISSVIASV